MGQYTPATFVASAALSSTAIWAEFLKIATAHNHYDFTDRFKDSVLLLELDRSTVINNKSLFTIPLAVNATITGAAASGTVQAYAVVPFDCQATRATAIATTVAAAADQEITVYREGTTDVKLFTNKIMAADATPYDVGSPLVSDLFAGDLLSLRLAWAGSQSCSGVNLTILAKAIIAGITE